MSFLDDLHLDRVGNVSVTGWAIVGGAAAVGEFLLDSSVAALALGAGALWYVLQDTPCCDGCAKGVGCGGAASAGPSTKASAAGADAMQAQAAVAGAFTAGGYGTGGGASSGARGACCGGAAPTATAQPQAAPSTFTGPSSPTVVMSTNLASPLSAGALRL